ncbi:DUF4148 domain-containing protein [Paraburkholderia sp. BCC1886]|uniref:DUF4148 domain-containing protein n=1 Tax=Paraburkholderia sp. BCC1886 TaxID=2562670 RepID=UPI0011821A66|nr:DUF4148 domain-containing protein [Paraburkholderia sp. BCC1886]
MRKVSLAVLVCMVVSGSAFAQTTVGSPAPAPSPVAPDNVQITSYVQPVMQKTRAQVYHELIEAQKDGQIAYLNRTVYAHH